jgi:hypothetical protein
MNNSTIVINNHTLLGGFIATKNCQTSDLICTSGLALSHPLSLSLSLALDHALSRFCATLALVSEQNGSS